MTIAVLIAAALGISLVVSGLPTVDRVRLKDRVDPYLTGSPSQRFWPDATGRRLARILGKVGISGYERIAERVAAAGVEIDPLRFRLDQALWAAAAMVASGVLMGAVAARGGSIDPAAVPVLTASFGVIGWLGPDWILARRIRKRRDRIRDQLPTATDLMTLSLVAGDSITSALARVHGVVGSAIGAEFGSVLADIRAGMTSTSALRGMKRRVETREMARLVDALCAAIERGSPLADVLRGQSEDARAARRRELLESGGRREVLMLIPVVFLILPTIVVFVLYPGLVSLDLLVP